MSILLKKQATINILRTIREVFILLKPYMFLERAVIHTFGKVFAILENDNMPHTYAELILERVENGKKQRNAERFNH